MLKPVTQVKMTVWATQAALIQTVIRWRYAQQEAGSVNGVGTDNGSYNDLGPVNWY